MLSANDTSDFAVSQKDRSVSCSLYCELRMLHYYFCQISIYAIFFIFHVYHNSLIAIQRINTYVGVLFQLVHRERGAKIALIHVQMDFSVSFVRAGVPVKNATK